MTAATSPRAPPSASRSKTHCTWPPSSAGHREGQAHARVVLQVDGGDGLVADGRDAARPAAASPGTVARSARGLVRRGRADHRVEVARAFRRWRGATRGLARERGDAPAQHDLRAALAQPGDGGVGQERREVDRRKEEVGVGAACAMSASRSTRAKTRRVGAVGRRVERGHAQRLPQQAPQPLAAARGGRGARPPCSPSLAAASARADGQGEARSRRCARRARGRARRRARRRGAAGRAGGGAASASTPGIVRARAARGAAALSATPTARMRARVSR